MVKPFRFGVQSFNADSGANWAEKVRQAENLGYSAFHLADHLLGPGPALEATNHPVQSLAAIPAMAYAAAVTETIHIGCRVFCIDYHNPVVLVKSAMTIDLLSGGRLEFGRGAGWLKGEYEAIGLDFEAPGKRIDRLARKHLGLKPLKARQLLTAKQYEALRRPSPAEVAARLLGQAAPLKTRRQAALH